MQPFALPDMYKIFFKHHRLRFRQFSRKAYAAFLSLHREVTIGRVSAGIADLELLKQGRRAAVVTLLGLVSCLTCAATESDDDGVPLTDRRQLALQEVMVVSRKAEVQKEAFRLVAQLSHDELVSLPVQAVADILQYLPGLDVRSRGANGSQADVSMRGGTFDQVLLLLNGVCVNDVQTGHYSLNMPVPVDVIERVEVLQGIGVGLFGLNAFCGAVNIVISRPLPLETDSLRTETSLRLTAGMNGLFNPAASLRLSKTGMQTAIAAEYLRAGGYYAPSPSAEEAVALANSDVRVADVYFQNSYRNVGVQAGVQYKDAGAGMFYGFGSLDQFDATRTAFASATWSKAWGRFSLDAQASYRANYDRYEWHRGHRRYGNFHFSQNASASLRAHYASAVGRTSVGVELRNDNIHSTNIGDTVNPLGQVPDVEGFDLKDVRVLDLVYGKNRLNLSYFAEQTFVFGDLSASLGVSGNWNSMFGNNFAGGAGLGYSYAPRSSVYVNAGRSLRLPTFTDLYYNAGNQKGNRDLRPEEAWQVSAGTCYTKMFTPVPSSAVPHMLSVSADAWFRWGRNIIDWVYVPSDVLRPYHAENQQQVNAAGAGISLSYSLNAWLRRVSVSYAYTWLSLDLAVAGSRYLDCLSHKLVLGVEHALFVLPAGRGFIGMKESLRWQKREGEYNDAHGDVQRYLPVCVLDASLFWQSADVRISADCTNITNRHYYDYGGLLQPGAWAKLTVKVNL